ncbi:MAG: hypothetical protein HZB92_02500 [Euryarchaeota archaeon]|nr:hypothetical protein [Euryarchaeota archaeon]
MTITGTAKGNDITVVLPHWNRSNKESITSALDNLIKRLNRIINFNSQALMQYQLNRIDVDTTFCVGYVSLKDGKKIPIPTFHIDHKKTRGHIRSFHVLLYYNFLTKIVETYELFLKELAHDVYKNNKEILAIDERQLTSREILSAPDIATVIDTLVENRLKKLEFSSYPTFVKRLETDFHIKFHDDDAIISLFEMHNIFEIRNVVVHNDGIVDKSYVERMLDYKEKKYLIRQSIKVDFIWIYDFVNKLYRFCSGIETKVRKKRKTSAD